MIVCLIKLPHKVTQIYAKARNDENFGYEDLKIAVSFSAIRSSGNAISIKYSDCHS